MLTKCQHSTDVDTDVTYMLDPLDARCSALAFGRPGRRYVALSSGLVILMHRNPEDFRAVVRHELAHIRNRDLDIGFLTIVAWRITLPLLVVMIPSSVVQPLNWSAASTAVYALGLVSAAMLLTLAVSVPLLRNSVLRSRELFADARAKQWAGNKSSIDAMLAAYFPKRRRWYPEALRIHPSPIRRQAVLLNYRLLAVTSAWEWIAVGLMAMMVRYELRQFVGSSPFISDLLGIAVAAVLVTITLGLAAWANIDRGEDPESREKSSRTAGLGLGMGLALSASLLQPDVATAVFFVGVSALGSFLLWIPFMCLAAWVARRWLSTVTSSWAEVIATQAERSAKTVFWAVLSVATIPVSLGLYTLLKALQFSLYAPISSKGGLLGGTELFFNLLAFFLTPSPATISLLLIAVALPLTGQAIRQKRRGWKQVPRSQIESFRPVPFGIFFGIALGWFAGFLVMPLVFIAADVNPVNAPVGFGVLVLAQMFAAVAMTIETRDPSSDYICFRWHQSLTVATSSSLGLGIAPLMEFKIIEWGFGWPVEDEARAAVFYGAVMLLGVVLGGVASAVTLALRRFQG
ncbi:M48 family metallopeptidase [Streptomyces acidicola]|uniref:M48 family metallopeptidase n=1 Tax=Streptomyces acidicola TaxID=2596892 RepID=UPI003806CE05